MVLHHLQHPPGAARLSLSRGRERDLLPYCHCARSQLHYPHFPASCIPKPPRGYVQARAFLYGSRTAWMGGEHRMHQLDVLRLCHLLVPHRQACHSTRHELCFCDHDRRHVPVIGVVLPRCTQTLQGPEIEPPRKGIRIHPGRRRNDRGEARYGVGTAFVVTTYSRTLSTYDLVRRVREKLSCR